MPTETNYGLSAYSVDITSDGKILVAGYSLNTSVPNFAIARLNSNGSLDTSFGSGGKVVTSFNAGPDIGRSIISQPDGKIIVAGYSDLGRNNGDSDFAVARYNINGTLDTSFGIYGKVTTAIGNPLWGGDYAYRVGLQADGSIIVSGSSATLTGSVTKSKDFAVVKYHPDGILDTSFSEDGITTVSIGNSSDQGLCQYIFPDGKILMGGWSESFIDGNSHYFFSMAMFNTDGSLDNSFGNAGTVSLEPSAVANWYTNNDAYHISTNLVDVRDLTVLEDGKIFVAGNFADDVEVVNGVAWIPRHMAVIGFNSDGTLNQSFGNLGIVDIPKIGFTDSLSSIEILDDGKIIVGGYGWTDADYSSTANIDFYLVRLDSNGNLDTTFNNSGYMSIDFNNNSRDYLFDMKVRSDGVIVVAGFTEKNNRADLAVALIGTNGDDAIFGTIRIDKIFGDGGDDVISGGIGADFIDGGDGVDTADFSNESKSVVVTLESSISSIVTINGIADDTLVNIENLVGGSGADSLTASSMGSELIGGSGNDNLNGAGGSDVLYAGNGNDSVSAGGGDDVIIGGDGAGNDIYNGGDDIDTVIYTSALAGIKVNLLTGTATSIGKNDASRIGNDSLINIENVTAGNFSDVIIGNNLSNTLLGMGGNDTLIAGAGADYLDGGAGIDTANYSEITQNIWMWLGGNTESSVSIAAEVFELLEFDTIVNIENFISGSGNDWLIGDSNANQLIGGLGNDTLDGGTGADTLIGGVGNDIYYVDNTGDVVTELSKDNTVSQEKFSMGNNNDVVVASISYTLAAGTTGIEDLMAAGDFTTGADTDIEINLTGNALGQGLIGNDAINVLNGMAGDDILVGFGGNDTLLGGDGNDGLLGGAGDDSMSGGKGNDIFVFNFAAQSGTNLIGETSDAVYVTGGSDTADGGEGIDILFMQGSLANYSISRIGLTQYRITTNVGNAVSSDEQITFQNIERLKFGSILDDIGSSSGFVDLSSINIVSSFNDTIRGTSGNDTLDGGAGADTLIGGAGNDIYYVDNTGDVVTELSKDNTVSQEKFSMGNNNDVVVASISYTLAAGTTGIEDMMAEGSLTGSLNSNAINLTGNALGQGLIGNDAINVLNGMAGDDALVGAGGADTLIGGDGNDWFFSGAGNDSMLGGKGTDLFFFNFGASPGTNLVGDAGDFDLTGGSDTADGGEGTADVLLMKGTLANYNISRTALTQYAITTKEGIDGISSDEQITFQNIEYLKFGDLSELGSSPLVALSSINIVSSFNDTIRGTSGNDTLDGDAGADTLIGGAGDDIYIVDNIGDKTTEVAAQGMDTVRSSITWTALAAHIENLTLTGTGDINGTGNTLNNIITGNSGNNILNGGAGNDTIDGGDGADTINGGDGNDTLSANAGGGAINGGVGNDTLYGGTGTDTLDGGAGNDILYNGGSGDTLIGGAGNDTYYIDNSTTLRESANGGIDTIITSISFDLQWLTNHENLTLTGSSSLFAAGNSLANTIIGNDGDNTINGSLGNDTLTGGLGNDIFVFNTAPNRTSNVDRITDFNVTDDTIQLENAVFTGLGSGTGTLDSSMFRSGAGFTTAGDGTDRIIYNTTSGALFYDADGTGGTAAVQIALIGNQANLTVADLVVI